MSAQGQLFKAPAALDRVKVGLLTHALRPVAMPARRAGRCSLCREPIEIGELGIWFQEQRVASCFECLAKLTKGATT